MERDIVDIITEKEFIQLTASEKADLQEFCKTEEEYNQMKTVFASVSTLPKDNLTPKAETKKDLDALFAQTYPKAAPIWYNSVLAVLIPKEKPIYRQPLLQVAAVALLIFLAVPLFNNPIVKENVQVAENKGESSEQDIVEDKLNDLVEKSENESKQSETANVVADNELLSEDASVHSNLLPDVKEDNDLHSRMMVNEEPTAIEVPISLTFTSFDADSFGAGDAEGFAHPDGVFVNSGNVPASTLSFSAAETEDLMDLLTATF